MCKSLWQKAKQCYIVINGRVSLEIDFQTRQQKGEKMKRIAKFHKVSFEQFAEGWLGEFPDSNREEAGKIYEEIKLPRRATVGSAGYDFFAPSDFVLAPGRTIKIIAVNNTHRIIKLKAEFESQSTPRVTFQHPVFFHLHPDSCRYLYRSSRRQHKI